MSNLRPNRRQLSEFLTNPQTIKAFESLFDRVLELTPGDNGGGGGSNVVIVTQKDIEDLEVATGTASNKATQALILIEELLKTIVSNIYIPPTFQGSLASQNSDNVKITGGSVDNVQSISTVSLTTGESSALIRTSIDLDNAAGAETATLTNAPIAGDPTKWISIMDNGVIRRIPSW